MEEPKVEIFNGKKKSFFKKCWKLLVGGLLVLIIILFGLALFFGKGNGGSSSRPSQDNIIQKSFSGLDSLVHDKNDDNITPTDIFPFTYKIGQDGYMYTVVNGQDFLTEFTSWGGHGEAMAGSHVEGNNKSNFRVLILPSGKTIEVRGNGNGVCDFGEVCGAPLSDIKANELWYMANYPHMKLIAIERDSNQDTSFYIPGEQRAWRLHFSFDGGLDFNLQHAGELSPEITQLIKDSGQSSVLQTTQYTRLSKKIDIPAGIKLARPQIMGGEPKNIGGQTIYAAIAQTEWTITKTKISDNAQDCQWKNYFTADIQAKMQKVLDTELVNPLKYGLFMAASGGFKISPETVSEGTLCASDSITTNEKFTKLSANNSFGFYKVNGANHPLGDVFSVYPIHKDSIAYQKYKDQFAPSADFMFRRGHDVSGFTNTQEKIVMSQGAKKYIMNNLSGEVVDLTAANDTPDNDHFIVKIEQGDNGASDMPIGKYFGVRYRLEKDRLVVVWGGLADSQSAVTLPAVIPANATCDGQTYSCYIHDFSSFK